MEDGIEQHSSMLLNNIEKIHKYMFLYSPSSESINKKHFVTYDFNEAIEFCMLNKCKIEIFHLNVLIGNYVSTNAFINPHLQ
jgi:hypothetical protein